MEPMPSPAVEPADLLDLKLLPAWVKQPDQPTRYERYTGEEESGGQKATQGPPHGKPKRRTSSGPRRTQNGKILDGPERKKEGRDSERLRGQRHPARSSSHRGVG